MQKRGQITILIIFAIAILVVIGITFLVANQSPTKKIDDAFSSLGISSQASIIESSVAECLKITGEDALTLIGLQGGYYHPPKSYETLDFIFIPYYYDQGNFLQPSKEKIESELSKYIDENLNTCTSLLNFEGFKLNLEQASTSTRINQNNILIITNLDLKISKDSKTAQFNLANYPIEINSKLNDIIDLATYITESHKENPDILCISCVTQMAEEKKLHTNFLDFNPEKNSTLIIISENQTDPDPYVFEFLNRY